MKLGIVGLGTIGRAVQSVAQCQTIGADKGDLLEPLKQADAIVICVGTPALENGACDTSALGQVLAELEDYEGLIVCHSTAPASFYAGHKRSNLVHVPEFVRGDHARHDYKTQYRLLIGGERETAEKVFTLWKRWLCPELESFVCMSVESAAIAKYTANILLATKVGLLNEIKPLADLVGANWADITFALSTDSRLGNTHWDVPGPDGKLGFGGACFPKDLSALIHESKQIITPRIIMSAVRRSNEAIRR